MMGIVKRLDDQKRMMDRMYHELEELRSTGAHDESKNVESQGFAALAQTLETALAANKRLADSVIKIRETLSGLLRENERLSEEVNAMKRDSSSSTVRNPRHMHDSSLRILQAVSAGSKSSTEISRIIQRSREHTARTIKRMVDQGLLEKGLGAYPGKYTLTEKAKELLEFGPTSTSE